MKKILLIALLSNSLFAQTINYSFSEEFETVRKHDFKCNIKCQNNQLISVFYQRSKKLNSIVFQSFDNNFKSLIKQDSILLPDKQKRHYSVATCGLKNNTYWLYTDKNSMLGLFALPFNDKIMKFDTTKIKLLDADSYDLFFNDLIYKNGSIFDLKYSNDSSKMLVVYGINPKNKKNNLNNKKVIIMGVNSKKIMNNSKNEIIAFNLFDSNLKKIYSCEVTLPILKSDLRALNYSTDSYGNIYIIVGYIDSNKEYQNELFKVNQKDNTLQSFKINLENKYIKTFYLKEDLNKNFIITGLYSNKKSISSAAGVYIIEPLFDEGGSIKKTKNTFSEYPAEVLKAYESARTKRKMDKKNQEGNLEAENLSFKKIVFNSDSTTVIIAEEYSMQISTMNDGKSSSSVIDYTYGDILVLKLDKYGKTIWCSKIPKYQSRQNAKSDLSFFHHQYNGDSYFFYLDNKKNMNLSLDETPYPYANGSGIYLTCVKIDINGVANKKSIFDIEDEAINLSPMNFQSVSDNLIIDYLKVDKNKSKIFKLEIE